ncbi:ImmA/IrrE family metallo-endopeptidase [Bacillus sp. FJAT-45350]|uniref:ImmA/IrrE family metallo-endopeptidase n=1 Tax=Bacillus sp. FJAT-45350 TaxID=2011014 RepID=UPI000BB7F891|nr:ImmA/IrrE family metallo-endopeptidase [Bacillus sp. FJAT-45350]
MKMKNFMLEHPLYDNAYKLAKQVHSNFNFNAPYQIDIEYICSRYGMSIKELPPSEVSTGLSIASKNNRKGTIFINRELVGKRRKEILAEEFCHIYSQHTNQLSADSGYIDKLEEYARRMSAHLLIPDCMLSNVEVYEGGEDYIIVSEIADHFDVTEEFAHYRLTLEFQRGLLFSLSPEFTLLPIKLLYKERIEELDAMPINHDKYEELEHVFIKY